MLGRATACKCVGVYVVMGCQTDSGVCWCLHRYGRDERLTEDYAPDIWVDYY